MRCFVSETVGLTTHCARVSVLVSHPHSGPAARRSISCSGMLVAIRSWIPPRATFFDVASVCYRLSGRVLPSPRYSVLLTSPETQANARVHVCRYSPISQAIERSVGWQYFKEHLTYPSQRAHVEKLVSHARSLSFTLGLRFYSEYRKYDFTLPSHITACRQTSA